MKNVLLQRGLELMAKEVALTSATEALELSNIMDALDAEGVCLIDEHIYATYGVDTVINCIQ